MENAFYIATCRFHVKEKDRLLITGYFLDNRPMETGLKSGWMERNYFIQRMESVFIR